MSEYMDKLIHVGFTNKYQLDYANDEEGVFYCDSDNECNIPLYMLSVHSMRAIDSVVVEAHDNLVEQSKALKALLSEAKSIIESSSAVTDTVWFNDHTTLCDKIEMTLEQEK